jgi:hypothetical protein
VGRDGGRHEEEKGGKEIKIPARNRNRSLFMKPIKIILVTAGLAIFILVFLVWAGLNSIKNYKFPSSSGVNNFEECIAAGNPILETYPRQCKASDGKTFTEDIGNALEKQNLIRVSPPAPNDLIKSPLTIKGQARGTWFFEASFPVRILDSNGVQLGAVPAQAKADWMTQEFVDFEATLDFQTSTTATGTLILEKDNPSGLPENSDELRVPIRFSK